MKNKFIYSISAIAMAIAVTGALPAFAETDAGVNVGANIGASTTLRQNGGRPPIRPLINNIGNRVENRLERRDDRVASSSGRMASSTLREGPRERRGNSSSTLDAMLTKAKARGTQEINRRVKSLTELSTRVSNMKKVSTSSKATLSAEIQTEITSLTNLKAKITADTDASTTKSDIQSITASYRIYALIMPQISILAAADRVDVLVDSFNLVTTKLQARITEATAAGKDTAAMTAALASVTAKVSDAKVQADAAISSVVSLTPDNGDKTVMASNTATLKAAREKIKTADKELKDARKEVESVTRGTHGINAEVHASSTVNVTP